LWAGGNGRRLTRKNMIVPVVVDVGVVKFSLASHNLQHVVFVAKHVDVDDDESLL